MDYLIASSTDITFYLFNLTTSGNLKIALLFKIFLIQASRQT